MGIGKDHSQKDMGKLKNDGYVHYMLVGMVSGM